MHTHTPVLILMTFLHDLFTALWIGGLVAFGYSFLPSARMVIGRTKETRRLVAMAQKRQSILIYVSMAGLAITGLPLGKRNPAFDGLFSFATPYSSLLSTKHVLMILLVGLTLYNSLFIHGERHHIKPKIKIRLSTGILFANIVIGIVILLLSSVLSVTATGA